MSGAGREAVHETVDDLTADPNEAVPGARASISDVEVTIGASRMGRLVRRLAAASISRAHLMILALVSVPLLAWLIVCLALGAPAWLTIGTTAGMLLLLGSAAALLRTETDTRRRRR
jgi:hypothetical protein